MRVICFLLVYLLSFSVSAQTNTSYTGLMTISAFPKNKQICERQKNMSTAKVKIAGTVAASSNYDKIKLSVSLDTAGNTFQTYLSLNYVGDSASFELDYLLSANFHNHKFILVGVNGVVETVEWIATEVVAGDIYIINGQSNAQAYLSAKPEDIVPFTRSFFLGKWDDLEHSFPGQWGAHLAKVMSQNLGFPIGIFNFADGAQPISYFQKNTLDSNANYSLMMDRLQKAGVKTPIAAFWFHGEANGWDTPIAAYVQSYETLHNSWMSEFDMDASFLFQVRHLGCAHPNPDIFEAHRLLAEENPEIHIMSTTNADQDSCHYRWIDGYRVLAERMAQIVKTTLYNQAIPSQDYAPNVKKVERFNANTLRITFEPAGVPLQIIGSPGFDFRHEESTLRATNVWTIADTLLVQFDTIINIGEHLSYLSHPGPSPDWVVTSNGVGILEFFNQPIVDYIVGDISLAQKGELIISPNPSTGSFLIDWNRPAFIEIIVLDALGRISLQKNQFVDSDIHLDISHLPQGVYQVVVKSKQKIQIGKLVKQD